MNRPIRIAPLLFGLAFIAIGVVGLTGGGDDVDVDTAWLWVAGFAAIGIAGLASVVAALFRRD